MKDNKIYIGLIGLILLFFIIAFFLLLFPNINKDKLKITIIVDNNAIFQYENQKWTLTNNEDNSYNWKDFNLYLNGQRFGNYYLWKNEGKWQAFDADRNPISLEGDLLAVRSNKNINIYPFSESKIEDTIYIANVLKQHNISLSSKLTSSSLIKLDFDNDGIVEDFYAISNAFSLNDSPSTVFSFAFMVKNNSIYMIFEDVRENNYYDACKPYYSGFIDINQDNHSEILLNCGRYSIENPLIEIFQFVNNKFETVISNE